MRRTASPGAADVAAPGHGPVAGFELAELEPEQALRSPAAAATTISVRIRRISSL